MVKRLIQEVGNWVYHYSHKFPGSAVASLLDRMPNLVVLDLSCCPIGLEGMEAVTRQMGLRCLNLVATDIGVDGVALLRQLPFLRCLDIQSCGFECVSTAFRFVVVLVLRPLCGPRFTMSNCVVGNRLGPALTDALMNLKELEFLSAGSNSLQPADIVAISSSLKQLQHFDVGGEFQYARSIVSFDNCNIASQFSDAANNVQAEGLRSICNLEDLRSLGMHSANGIEDAISSLQALKNLEALCLCEGIPLDILIVSRVMILSCGGFCCKVRFRFDNRT